MTQKHHNEKWAYDTVKKAALSCTTKSEFSEKFSGAKKWAIRNGCYDDVCAHMRERFLWNIDLVKAEASKFESRSEFHEGNVSAALWALRNGVMDDLFPHKLTMWDLESVSKEALKYSHREEFRLGCSGAAQWAARNGLWEVVCSHMDLAGKCDYDCIYIWKPSGFQDLYKIGITSKRLGVARIEYVSRSFGFEVDLLYIKGTDNALKKEKEMLLLGTPAKMNKSLNGFSEFRHLTHNQFRDCLRIMGVHESKADHSNASAST